MTTSHEEGKDFHHAWLLILISFFVWYDQPNYQLVYIIIHCKGEKYQNIWFTLDKNRKIDTNIDFFMHKEALMDQVRKQTRLEDDTIKWFRQIIKIQIKLQYVMTQTRHDPPR